LKILDVFEDQATACAELGSPFTAQVLRIARDQLSPNDALSQRILNWQGDPSTGADSVPLRLSGALHALVLTGQCAALADVYPPNETNSPALASAIEIAFRDHAAHILDWLNNAPQTNETARSAPLIATAHLLTDVYALPLRLLELGTSAGLNLRWDHMAVETDDRQLGPKGAAMRLRPDWHGDLPQNSPLKIIERAGVDLNPLDASNPQDQLRLMAYIWPDQPDRLVRMRQALDLAAKLPAEIDQGDAIDWLENKLARPHVGNLTTIFHTIAWQYFPKSQQAKGKTLIEAAGANATPGAPIAWVSMESDGASPGAALGLRLWPGDHTVALGRADFHGRWVRWEIGSHLHALHQPKD
jgi:hypothetical protein